MADLAPATANEQLHAMLDAITDHAIYVLDPYGAVASWNTGAQRIKGYAPTEIIGENFAVFFTSDDAADGRPQRLLSEASRTGRALDEGWRVRKDGSRFWATVVITPLHGPDGELRGYVKVVRDDTDRRLAERERRMLAAFRDHERLARDLNDDVINRIFAAGLHIESMRDLVRTDAIATTKIDEAVAELDEAINRLRVILFRFEPEDDA